MPIKHQGDSYRTRKGELYTCWTDELFADHRNDAKRVVASMRQDNIRAFAEHVDDEGYSRVFVHEGDACKAGIRTKGVEKIGFFDVMEVHPGEEE
jgi:hypothetical protein